MITREKTLRGYEVDIINNTVFAIYDNKLIEDGVIISKTRHRETMNEETAEEIKLNSFVDEALLVKAQKISDLQTEIADLKKDKK